MRTNDGKGTELVTLLRLLLVLNGTPIWITLSWATVDSRY
jgi:hypothetical protein